MNKKTSKHSKKKSLQLIWLDKEKGYYTGGVVYYYDTIKCLEGHYVEFKQKKIPKELESYFRKDMTKFKRSVYVICDTSKVINVSSTVIDGGEEYFIPTMPSKDSKVKILSFDRRCNS